MELSEKEKNTVIFTEIHSQSWMLVSYTDEERILSSLTNTKDFSFLSVGVNVIGL